MRTTKWRAVFASLFLLLSFFVSAPVSFAAQQRVYDDAGLLTGGQVSSLEEQIGELRSQLDLDLVVVTTDDTGGKSSRDYADDYYDNNGFGVGSDKRGVLFLIDMDNRQAYLSTCGKGIDYLTDARIDHILDLVVPRLKEEDYQGAVQAFLTNTKNYVLSGVPDNQYRYDEETGKVTKRNHSVSWKQALLFLGLAVVVGAIAAGGVAAKYKLRFKDSTYPVREKSRVRLTCREDVFLRRYVTSRRIETNHSSGGGSGGGSSTHSSGGGTTHGGGGRGF